MPAKNTVYSITRKNVQRETAGQWLVESSCSPEAAGSSRTSSSTRAVAAATACGHFRGYIRARSPSLALARLMHASISHLWTYSISVYICICICIYICGRYNRLELLLCAGAGCDRKTTHEHAHALIWTMYILGIYWSCIARTLCYVC